MINKFNIIFWIILLFSAGCGKRNADVVPVSNLSFNEYFGLVKKSDVINKMNSVMYFGPTRGQGKMEIDYKDGTEASFYLSNYQWIHVYKEGSKGQKDEDKIESDIYTLGKIYKELRFKSISVDLLETVLTIHFDLDAVNKETLPEYIHPHKMTDKFHFNEGELIFSLDNSYEYKQSYFEFKPTKVADEWYLLYY